MSATDHTDGHDGRTPNRLIHEKSPYLLQHAYNPVDWYPWGEEAFARAKAEDKPIFLSIGYSTCHWCHVMERESFENESIAALMNANFVCIKVDREERPDVDHIYMTAVQAMTRQGGWPMSMFLTPDAKPFWGGTYFPPEDRGGRPGFPSILVQLGEAWRTRRTDVIESANRLTTALNEMPEAMLTIQTPDAIGVGLLDQAFDELARRFEPTFGGFSTPPKFPSPHNVLFLLRHAHRTGNDAAIDMARKTLDMMAVGGIHDHLGGGFHRYSVDTTWLAPHFEKMLYDQAGLAKAYVEAWLVTGAAEYRHVAMGICDYVLRDMTDEGGGFYAAEDADSEGHEGTFYVWTPEEVDRLLGDDGPRFRKLYDVTEGGNFEGKNILHPQAFEPMLDASLDPLRTMLFEARAKRIRPHLDDKIITAWNGYMIESFALAGRAFDEPRYTRAAARAADFIWDSLRRGSTLLRHHRGGAADIEGYIDDYAFYGRGMVALFEVSGDPKWLERAIEVSDEMVARFRDESGVFRFTSADAETLIAPTVEAHDGALPAGNSAAAGLLMRLGHIIGDREREQMGYDVLVGLSGTVSRSPSNHIELMSALAFSTGPISEIVIAGAADDDVVVEFRREIASRYRPNTVVIERTSEPASRLEKLIPFVTTQGAIGGKATAYVCRDYACRLPVHDAASFAAELDK